MKITKWTMSVIMVGVLICLIVIARKTLSTRGGESEVRGLRSVSDNNLKPDTNPNLTKSPTKKLILKNTTIDLLVAETPDETMWGLSDFPSLPTNTGMMFVFPDPGMYSFWMKDMKFPLDMIWLDGDNRVVTIHENISPDTYMKNPPELFNPTKPASAVIEVPGGFIQQNNLSVGDILKFVNI